ncbi:DNA repair protein RecO [Comamonas jiangduensis]|uniref:DNA repair protein RecO n=1 Tax=Comamonas jiangduensis TaxID=1194168 RepID=UPI0028A9E382|nr:DNA repair protein RecO [Comamonas jiangduensis]
MAAKRVGEEPAFILHRYDWSESSLILEVFTRHRGRVALLAKGVKRHTSNFRPVLLALQPLKVSYTLSGDGNADIHVLKGAEWAGGHIMPMGNNLLTGLYLNELLMRLLARDDPYAYLFDVYGAVVKLLATQQEEVIEPVLRAFELIVLRELGLLPSLELETQTLQALAPEKPYVLVAEMGVRPALASDRAALTGQQWCQLQKALEQGEGAYPAAVRACAAVASALKPQLRHLLQYHCGTQLRTRQLMMDLQTL